MPLLSDIAHTVALIRHVMDLIKCATQHLNPSQTPILTMDQPLFAIAKEIQWQWPAEYGEQNYIIMLGGLHIEMAAFKTIGDWLKGSGWVSGVADAGVLLPGIAESCVKVTHLKRTRHIHQITAVVLHILQQRAYMKFRHLSDQVITFEEWQTNTAEEQPQFKYWSLVLEFELCILQLVQSIRIGNFQMYVQCLTALIPWFFALDHVNYSRWLSVHIRDLTALETTHPDVFRHFCAGAFVVRKTKRRFSSIALDHAHEQCNAQIKGDGGAIGLTNNPSALRRWMIAGPEISSRMVTFSSPAPFIMSKNFPAKTNAIQTKTTMK